MGSSIVMTLTTPEKTGAARMAFNYCQALIRADYPVFLLHGPEPSNTIVPEMVSLGVKCHLEKGLAFPLGGAVSRRTAEFARACQAGAIIGVNQRDRAVALEAAHKAGVRGLVMVQNLHRFWGATALLKEFYYSWTLRRRTHLAVCCSQAVRDEVECRFGLSNEQLEIVPNGIETQRYGSRLRQPTLRTDLGLSPQTLLLANVGRLDYQKGQDLLLDVMSTAQLEVPWHLVMVGDCTTGSGERRSKEFADLLRSRVKSLGFQNSVTFLGWREDIPELLASSDVYLHTARYEGWPLSVLEAMASEIPVISSDCVGRPKGFVDNEHGFIVKSEDVKSFAEALRVVVSLSTTERRSWGESAGSLVREHYDVYRLGETFVKLVEQTLSQ
jgi:glycosyltransferase involved in cell wall biosynthesis